MSVCRHCEEAISEAPGVGPMGSAGTWQDERGEYDCPDNDYGEHER